MSALAGHWLDIGWTGVAKISLIGWTGVAKISLIGWTGWTRPANPAKNDTSRQPVENTKPQVRGIFIHQHTSPAYEPKRSIGWTRPAYPANPGPK